MRQHYPTDTWFTIVQETYRGRRGLWLEGRAVPFPAMTSKYLYWLPLALLLSIPALAQTAPGWSWVREFSDQTMPNPTSLLSFNTTAGVGRDAAGNVYMAGACVGNLTIGPPPTTTPRQDPDVFVAKYTQAGTLLWVRTLYSPGDDAALDIVVSPAGRCTIAGRYSGTTGLSFASFGSSLVLPPPASPSGACYLLPFVAAINPDGSLAWASSPAPANLCGVSPTYNTTVAGCLATDAQDNVYWSVKVRPVATGSGSPSDNALLLKLNASGQLQWSKQAVGQSGRYDVQPTSLRADQAGNLYWAVSTYAFTLDNVTYGGTPGHYLLKLTAATPQVQWVKGDVFQFAPGSSNQSYGYYDIAGLDEAAGKLYFCVTTWGSNILHNGSGSPVVVPANPQAGQIYLAQTDLNAQVQWVKQLANLTLPSNTSTYSYNTLAYPSGTGLVVLTSTLSKGTTNFVGDAATYIAAQAGLVVVARFNPATGLTEWVRTGGTDYGEFEATSQLGTTATNLAVDPTGNAYVAGLFHGPAHFGSQALSPNFKFKTYLAKLDQSVLPTRKAVAGRAWQPYPNPATGSVFLSGLPTGAHVSLLDALGRPVRQTTSATLGLSGLAPGLYLLQVEGTPDPYQPRRLTVE